MYLNNKVCMHHVCIVIMLVVKLIKIKDENLIMKRISPKKHNTPKNKLFNAKHDFFLPFLFLFFEMWMKCDLDFSEINSNPVLVTRGQYRIGLTPITNIPHRNTHKLPVFLLSWKIGTTIFNKYCFNHIGVKSKPSPVIPTLKSNNKNTLYDS